MNRRGFLKLAGGAGALLGTAGALAAIGKAPPAPATVGRQVYYSNFFAPSEPPIYGPDLIAEPLYLDTTIWDFPPPGYYKPWRWSGQTRARFARICDSAAPRQLGLFDAHESHLRDLFAYAVRP